MTSDLPHGRAADDGRTIGKGPGLRVETVLDPGTYPTRLKISDKQIKAVTLTREQFHGE